MELFDSVIEHLCKITGTETKLPSDEVSKSYLNPGYILEQGKEMMKGIPGEGADNGTMDSIRKTLRKMNEHMHNAGDTERRGEELGGAPKRKREEQTEEQKILLKRRLEGGLALACRDFHRQAGFR
jgi:hypothetical protein